MVTPRRYDRLAVALASILLVLGATWAWLGGGPRAPSGDPSEVVPMAAAVPGGAFTLTDHTGKTVSDRDFRGRFMLLVFGYTFCPDVCPTTLQRVATALDLLGARSGGVQPLFVTIDPARDGPEQLAAFVGAFDERLIGLTGTPDQIDRIARNYRVYRAKVETGDDYLMDHSAFIYLVGPDGDLRSYFPHDAEPQALASAVARFVDGERQARLAR